jgi:parallel beta helix pectate lyase-like protein
VSGRRLRGFELSGFTVQGFGDIGVYLTCVDVFRIVRNIVTDNGRYAIFPVRSARGRIVRNTTARTRSDACLYTGQDTQITVGDNEASDCEIGLQIENSSHVRFTRNIATRNTVGMVVDVIDGRQVKIESDNIVTNNVLADNNRTNTAPPGYETSMLPSGIGLVMDAPDRTFVARNRITGNAFVGLTLVNFCIGEPGGVCAAGLDIDPNPDGNRVVGNRFQNNATDVIYFPADGQGNCFARNEPADLKVAGRMLPACRGRGSG